MSFGREGFIVKAGSSVSRFHRNSIPRFLFDPCPGLIQDGIAFLILNHYTNARRVADRLNAILEDSIFHQCDVHLDHPSNKSPIRNSSTCGFGKRHIAARGVKRIDGLPILFHIYHRPPFAFRFVQCLIQTADG